MVNRIIRTTFAALWIENWFCVGWLSLGRLSFLSSFTEGIQGQSKLVITR